MEYKDYTAEQVEEFKGEDDSLLLDGISILIAEGDGWEAYLKTYGEIRGTYHTENGDEPIYNSNINDFFATNDEISKAEADGKLILDNNNWFDLEFISDNEYLDIVSDDAVSFSVREGVEIFKDYMADKEFCELLQSKVQELRDFDSRIRYIFKDLVKWVENNCPVEKPEDMPLMFRGKYQQILTDMVMEAKNGN